MVFSQFFKLSLIEKENKGGHILKQARKLQATLVQNYELLSVA